MTPTLAILARCVLLATVLAAPWLYGGVFESTFAWIAGGIFTALLLALPAMATQSARSPVALITLSLAVMWSGWQLVPLPIPVAEVFSPGAVALRAELLPSQFTTDAELRCQAGLPRVEHHRQTITLRPSASRHDWIWLATSVAAFIFGASFFAQLAWFRWLCALVGLNGAALALLGFAQKLTWNGQIYWIGMDPTHARPFASFGNPNNAAGYLLLCLAAAVGITTWLFTRDAEQDRDGRFETLSTRFWQLIARLDAPRLAPSVLCICILSAVLATASRGGGIALLAAASITAAAVAYHRKSVSQPVYFAFALVAGLGLIAWVGLYDLLEGRLLTLTDPGKLMAEGRYPNWQDALRAVPDFPLTGSGLATYRDIYHLYQYRHAPSWFYFAENQYVQAVVDAGIVGLVLMVLTILLVARSCWTLLGTSNQIASARHVGDLRFVGQVGLFALTGQVVAAVFDFGLYLPANMLLMAVLCGSVSGAAARVDGRWTSSAAPRLTLIVGLLLLPIGLWGCLDFRQASTVATALRQTDFTQAPGAATLQQLTSAIDRLTPLTDLRPDDAELRYQLAKLHVHRYQASQMVNLRKASPPEVLVEDLWERASTTALHRTLHAHANRGNHDAVQRMRTSPDVQRDLLPALQQLLLARAACPILAKVHLRIARLSVLVGEIDAEAVHLVRACRVEPSNSYIRTRAGRLHAQAGRFDRAVADWREIVGLDPRQSDLVRKWAVELLPQGQLVQVFPNGLP